MNTIQFLDLCEINNWANCLHSDWQKLSESIQRSPELVKGRTSNDAGSALEVIAEALLIRPHSKKLLELKAESLFMLRKYEGVIQLCEQTLDSAGKNSPPTHEDFQFANLDSTELKKDSSFNLRRCHVIFKSYFYLGRLEEAISFLEKQAELDSATRSLFGDGSKMQESLIPSAAKVRELVHLKSAGNEAFQAGRHSEAIGHYTAALSRNMDSRPFAAICFCNRAAAYKALGQITDAIADCSLAIALDGNYFKVIPWNDVFLATTCTKLLGKGLVCWATHYAKTANLITYSV